MPLITLLGLGPGDPQLITGEARAILERCDVVYLRTSQHPAVAALPPERLRTFDHLYQDAVDFADVYRHIAEQIVAMAEQGEDVTYAVPGHPLVGEASSALILQRAKEKGIPVRVIAGVSFVESVLAKLAIHLDNPAEADLLQGWQICDALELAQAHHPPLNPDRPALIAQMYSRLIASDVKLTLMNQYPPRHPVFIVRETESAPRRVPLHELDHSDAFDHLTSVCVPPVSSASGFEALQELVAHLRAPEGCPWDREQTHESLRHTLLEETYEVLHAIDTGDMRTLREELGDLLLNVVMQVQIATEGEVFRMTDVIADVIAKLIRRHPHVFGEARAHNAEQVLAQWHALKQRERAAATETASALDGIAPTLPALAQAQKMAHRAEQAGFRWQTHEERLRKVREELEEVIHAQNAAHRAEEFGDLIFTIANWADGYGVDIETASRNANLKFARRFRRLESLVRAQGRELADLPPEALQQLWQQAKSADDYAARP